MSLGIGVFTIPYTFLQLGALHGAFWVLVLGLFADLSLECLLDCAAALGVASYEGLAKRAFGGSGEVAMMLITLVTTFIATLSYLGSVRDLLVGVLVAFFVDFDVNNAGAGSVKVLSQGKSLVLLCVLAGAVLPRCLSRSMGSNAWISAGGVFAVTTAAVFFVGSCAALLVGGCSPASLCGERPPLLRAAPGDALTNVATLAFSFSMCFALFPVLQERISNGNVALAARRLKPSVRMSIAFSCSIYLVVGLIGVFTFGSNTRPLALANPSLTSGLTQLINAVVGTSTLLLVAIVAFPVVQTLEQFGDMCCPAPAGRERDARPPIIVVVGLLAAVIDTFVPTKVAFALAGSLGLALGAYLMPCLLFLRLRPRGAGADAALARAGAAVVALFGCVLLFGSTPVTVLRAIEAGDAGAPGRSLVSQLCNCSARPDGAAVAEEL